MVDLKVISFVTLALFIMIFLNNNLNNNLNQDFGNYKYPIQVTKPIITKHFNETFNYYNSSNNSVLDVTNLQPLQINLGFQGLSYGQSNPYTPPDVQIAVSENYVVEFVNVLGGVWDKNGNFLGYLNLYSLFDAPYHYIGDPRILYDKSTGRFFASVFDGTINAVRIAVSSSSNPFGSWYVYVIPQDQGYFPDQPYLGINDDKVVVTANLFDTTDNFIGVQFWVLNKNQLISGSLNYYKSNIDPNVASIRPAIHLSSTNAFYMATTWTTSSNVVYVYKIQGTPPSSLAISVYSIPVAPFYNPPKAYQKDSLYLLDTVDYRIQDIIWKNNRLIFTANVGCVPYQDTTIRSCLRTIEIDTNEMSLVQDFNFSEKGKYYFFGSLKLSNDNVLYLVFGLSSDNDYPSLMATYQTVPNSFEAPILIKAGTGPETTGCYVTYCRYGDYFGSSPDPSDDSAWIAGEYGRVIGGWATWIAQISLTQYYIIANYEVIGGEGGSPPSLTYYYQGNQITVQLTKEPKKYLADKNSPWYITNPLQGSNERERWYTNYPINGIVSSPTTYVSPVYYHQYFVNFKFEAEGAGYSNPVISVFQFGNKINYNLPTSVWADANSRFNSTNPLVFASDSERWASNNNEGIVNRSGDYVIKYFHQYKIEINFKIIGKNNLNKPEISFISFGSKNTAKANTTIWADANTSYNITNPLQGSNERERWYTNNSTTSILNSPLNLTIVYYHQYIVIFNYEILGGGEGKEPKIYYISFGKSSTTKPNVTVWADSNTMYTFENPLPNSNNGERWFSKNNKGLITTWGEIKIVYYHQYIVIFNYEILGGGEGKEPKITVSIAGLPNVISINQATWVDANTVFKADDLLPNSNNSERWASNNNEGIVNRAGVYKITYYHQYLLNFRYSIVGKVEPPSSPSLIAKSFGEDIMFTLSRDFKSLWLDANSDFSALKYIEVNKERWFSDNNEGIVDAPKNVDIVYYHQYYVEINVQPKNAATTNIQSGWYNEGEVITININENKGWKFHKWEGTYQSDNPSITITVNSPIQLNAEFLVLLKIYSDGNGVIRFGDKIIQPNSFLEVYIVPGSEVQLIAEPSLFFKLVSWSTGEKSDELKLSVNEPTEIHAKFDLDYILILLLLFIIILALIIVLLVRKLRKG